MTVRALALAALVAVALLGEGCGGSKAPSVASLGTTSTAGKTMTSPTKPSRAAFASCLSSHGFQASVGSALGGHGGPAGPISGEFPRVVAIGGNVDPSSTQFQSALQACRKFLPGGGPPALTPAQQAEHAKAMASFAACMPQAQPFCAASPTPTDSECSHLTSSKHSTQARRSSSPRSRSVPRSRARSGRDSSSVHDAHPPCALA